jgi:hypothetical protein
LDAAAEAVAGFACPREPDAGAVAFVCHLIDSAAEAEL